MTDPQELSDAQEAALPTFIKFARKQDICEVLDLGSTTYHAWINNPVFRDRVKQLRNEVVEEAINLLRIQATNAISTIINIMEDVDETAGPALQLKAANDIFIHLTKWKELQDIEERLCAVERFQSCNK